jgi:uncharacterized membrane protein YcaP (DUF421 family)
MLSALQDLLAQGVEPKDLTALQVSVRAAIVFVATIALVRVADKRFLAKLTALDVIVGFILASMIARAINGSSRLVPTLAGAFVVILLHRLFCKIAFRSDRFGELVKGHADRIIKDGKVIRRVMKAHDITEQDLLEELRQEQGIKSPSEVKEAFVERSGKISVIPFEKNN